MDTIQNIEENNLNTEGVKTKKEKKSFNFKLHLRIILAIGIIGLLGAYFANGFLSLADSWGDGEVNNFSTFFQSIFYFLHSILAILAFIFLKFKKKIGIYFLITFYLFFLISMFIVLYPEQPFSFWYFIRNNLFVDTVISGLMLLFVAIPIVGIVQVLFLGLSIYEIFYINKWKSFLDNRNK